MADAQDINEVNEDTFLRQWQVFTPSGFQGRATTVLDALRQGRRVLSDENKWVKANWFCNSNPDLDTSDAFCNSWQVCAAGAIGIVTIGNHSELGWNHTGDRVVRWVFDEDTYQHEAHYQLYSEAVEALRSQLPDIPVYEEEYDEDRDEWVEPAEPAYVDHWADVPTFNDADTTSYQDVVKAFDKAISVEEAKQLTSALT